MSQSTEDDASFGRSAGTAVGRAVALLVAAVLLGVVLLNSGGGEAPRRVTADVVSDDDSSDESEDDETTSSTAPTTSAAPSRPPDQIKVLAANGTKSKGVAGVLTETLKGLGYNALAPVPAAVTAETVVYVTMGYEREANELAILLALSPSAVKPLTTPPPVKDVRGANLLVVVGADLAQRITSGGGPGGGSTTTVAGRGGTTTTTRRGASTTTTARGGATTTTR